MTSTLDAMSNPGPKFFGQHTITVDVWVDPTKTDAALWAVLDGVQVAACNAVEEAMKAIDAPDQGVEVVVR